MGLALVNYYKYFTTNRILKDIFTTLFSRAFLVLTALGTSIVIARALGPAARGNYFFIITIGQILLQICTFGLQTSNTFIVAKDKSKTGVAVINSLLFSLVTGILAAIISILVFRAFKLASPEQNHLMYFLLILVPCSMFITLCNNILLAINKVSLFNILTILLYGGILLLTILLVFISKQVFIYLAAYVFTWLLVCILLFYALSPHFSLAEIWRFDMDTFRRNLHIASKVYISTLCSFVALKINVIILNHYYGSTMVGYYSVASQIFDGLTILPVTIASIIFPKLVHDPIGNRALFDKSLSYIFVLFLIICIVIALLAKFIIHLLFGAAFLSAVPMLLTLLPGVLAFGAISIMSQLLTAIGFPKRLMYSWLALLIAVLALSLILVKPFGGVGAAAAISVPFSIFAIVIFYWLKYNEAWQQ